jgi:hypothetical protein
MNTKQAWHQIMLHVRTTGKEYIDQDGRACKELLNYTLTIQDPSDTLDVVREMQRQKNWVYPSPEELRSIILSSPQTSHDYSYVPRLFGGLNQIDNFVIPLLKSHPQSRRAVAMLYQPESDSKISAKNVPALLCIHVRLLDTLELTAHIRSNDVFIGFPANVYQLRCLQEYIAKQLGVQSGPLHIFSNSAHFFTEYEPHYENIVKKK